MHNTQRIYHWVYIAFCGLAIGLAIAGFIDYFFFSHSNSRIPIYFIAAGFCLFVADQSASGKDHYPVFEPFLFNLIRHLLAYTISVFIGTYTIMYFVALMRRGEYETWIVLGLFGLVVWLLFYLIFPSLIRKWKGTSVPTYSQFIPGPLLFGIAPILLLYVTRDSGDTYWPLEIKYIAIGMISGVCAGFLSGTVYWFARYYKNVMDK